MKGLRNCNQQLVRVTEWGEHLPKFLRITGPSGNLIAYIFLYFDNIGMFCTDKVAAAHMRSKVLKVFSAAGITMKEQEFFEAATMQEGRPQFKGAFYLGAQIAQKFTHGCVSTVVWRHEQRRVDEAPSLLKGGEAWTHI